MRDGTIPLSSPCSKYHQKFRCLKELRFSICPVHSLGLEKRQLTHRKENACVCFLSCPDKREQLSVQFFKDFLYLLDLLGPGPRKNILVRTMIRDLNKHYISTILSCSFGKKSFIYYERTLYLYIQTYVSRTYCVLREEA